MGGIVAHTVSRLKFLVMRLPSPFDLFRPLPSFLNVEATRGALSMTLPQQNFRTATPVKRPAPQELLTPLISPSHQAIQSSIIESYGTFLPSTTVSSAATVKAVRGVKFIPLRYVTGIKKRRASDDYSSLALAIRAVTKCFARSSYHPQEIDMVICCHIAKLDEQGMIAEYEPTTALQISAHFGMTGAICYDINNACAGMFTAVYIVDKMIRAGTIRRALICSGEHLSPLCRTAQKEIESLKDTRLACLTLGDAGAALILDGSCDEHIGFKHTAMKTLPAHSRLCMAGPTRKDHGGIIMHTQSSAITRAGRDETSRNMIEKISKKLISIGPATKIITHQVAVRPPLIMRKMVNENFKTNLIKKRNLIINVGGVGNTASTSHIVALASAVARGAVKSHEDVLFSVQASGITIGVFQYKFDHLPQKIQAIKAGKFRPQKDAAIKSSSAAQPLPKLTPKVMLQKIAVSEGSGGNTIQMAAASLRQCMEQSAMGKDAIHYLIHCGLYRTDTIEEPSHAALIAGELGLTCGDGERTIFCFDVVNAEVGWLNACQVASTCIDNKQAPHVVITASECDENRRMPGLTSLNIVEMGSAVLLQPSDGTSGFSHFHFHNDHTSAGSRQVKFVGAGKQSRYDIAVDPNFEEQLIDALSLVFRQKIGEDLHAPQEFKYFIFPQRSRSFLERLASRLDVPMSQVIDVTRDEDPFTSAIPLALMSCLADAKTKKGDRALIMAASSGIQVGMAIYTF